MQARSSNLIRELKDTLERLFTVRAGSAGVIHVAVFCGFGPWFALTRSRGCGCDLRPNLSPRAAQLNSRLHVAIVEQRAEAELRIKAESAAVEKQRMFVMMISHEIRTPLNALLGAAQLLADTEMNGEQVELMELLAAGANHVVLIVDDILNYGAIQSGNFPLAFEPLDVARAVVEPAWRMIGMSRTHKEKLRTLKLRKSIAPDVPAVIVGDAPRLVQVLTNLLNNSIKFTNEGALGRRFPFSVRFSRFPCWDPCCRGAKAEAGRLCLQHQGARLSSRSACRGRRPTCSPAPARPSQATRWTRPSTGGRRTCPGWTMTRRRRLSGGRTRRTAAGRRGRPVGRFRR